MQNNFSAPIPKFCPAFVAFGYYGGEGTATCEKSFNNTAVLLHDFPLRLACLLHAQAWRRPGSKFENLATNLILQEVLCLTLFPYSVRVIVYYYNKKKPAKAGFYLCFIFLITSILEKLLFLALSFGLKIASFCQILSPCIILPGARIRFPPLSGVLLIISP